MAYDGGWVDVVGGAVRPLFVFCDVLFIYEEADVELVVAVEDLVEFQEDCGPCRDEFFGVVALVWAGAIMGWGL